MSLIYIQEELKAELAELEQEELDTRLAGAEHVPVHHPAGAVAASGSLVLLAYQPALTSLFPGPAQVEELDEEAELKKLQEALAM